MRDYLIASETDATAEKAIIVLPDIWGQTDYSYSTLKQLTERFKCPCYLLDYFYEITKTPSKFNPETDEAKALSLMDMMRGEEFMDIFTTALNDIKVEQPKLKQLAVIGFCFGGRLAYLSGLAGEVSKIVSFYGAGAHTENYLDDKSPITALCDKRKNDKQLKVLSKMVVSQPMIKQKLSNNLRVLELNTKQRFMMLDTPIFSRGDLITTNLHRLVLGKILKSF